MRGAKTTKRVERQLRISELQSTDLKCGVWAGRLLVLWGGEEAVASAAAPNLPNQSRRWARCGRSCGGCVRVNGQSSRVSLWGQCGWHIDLAHAPSPTRSQFWKWTWTPLAILVIELVMNMCPPERILESRCFGRMPFGREAGLSWAKSMAPHVFWRGQS